MLEKMQRERSPYSLLLSMQINIAIVEISLEVSQELQMELSWTQLFLPKVYIQNSTLYHREYLQLSA